MSSLIKCLPTNDDDLFAIAFEHSPIGKALLTSDGRFIDVNHSFCKFLGYDRKQLLKLDFQTVTHPADLNDGIHQYNRLFQQDIPTFELEKRYIHRDGQILWGHLSVSIVTDKVKGYSFSIAQVVDITARKQLAERDGLFEAILNNSTDIITYSTPEGICEYVSPSVEALLGYQPHEIIGRQIDVFYHPDDVDMVKQMRRNYTERGQHHARYTCRILCKNGNYLWFETTANMLPDERTQADRRVAVSRDVSEQIRLQESLEHAVRIAGLGHWDWNLVDNHIVFSEQAKEILGMKMRDSYLTYDRFMSMLHPDDVPLTDKRVKKSIEMGMPFDTTFRFIRQDGHIRFLHSQGEVLFNELGVPLRMIGAFQDITKRRELENQLADSDERYERLVENCVDGIGMTTNGHWTYLNQAGLTMFGVASLDELKGKSYVDFVHRDSHDLYLANREAFLNGETSGYTELKFNRLDGSTFYAEVIGIPICGSTYQIVMRDISERKDAEALLARSEKLSSIGQLAAGIAHEIRNPLTSLKGFTSLLHKRSKQPNKQFFEIMKTELDRIDKIVSQMLVLSKPNEVHFQPNDILTILAEVTELLATEATLKNVGIQFNPTSTTLQVEGDEGQLKQVFLNVIKNAIEAMPTGGDIRVDVNACDNEVNILVEDNGMGISEMQIAQLGEPFFTTKQHGTGLGLMVTHKIITAHHGRIRFESEVGSGTRVTISLPRFA